MTKENWENLATAIVIQADKNAKCKHYFTKRDDSFQQDWTKYKSIFINPPYTSKVQDEDEDE